MTSQPQSYVTPDEHLAVERRNEYKSEYIDGEVVAMTGASRNHSIIAFNIATALGPQLRGRPCEGYISEMRVRIPKRGYVYPDVVVVCGEPQLEDDYFDTLLNPTAVIELLSESTERYDRTKKFALYRPIDSLAEHVLVEQNEHRIEQYTKQPDGRWLLSDHRSPGDLVELASVRCILTLREVYEKVSLPPSDLKEGQLL